MNEDDEINAAHPDTPQTFILKGGQQLGPFTDVRITDGLRNGIYGYDDLCWREGMPDWQALEAIFPNPGPRRVTPLSPDAVPSQDIGASFPDNAHIANSRLVAWISRLRGVIIAILATAALLLVIAVLSHSQGSRSIVGTWVVKDGSDHRRLVINEKLYFEFFDDTGDSIDSFGKCEQQGDKYELIGFNYKGKPVDRGSLELMWDGENLTFQHTNYSRTSLQGTTSPDIEENYLADNETTKARDALEAKAEAVEERNRPFYSQLQLDADQYAQVDVQSDNDQNGIPSSPPVIGDLEAKAEQRWRVYESGDMKKRNFPDGFDSEDAKDEWIKEYLTTYIATLKPLVEEKQRRLTPAF